MAWWEDPGVVVAVAVLIFILCLAVYYIFKEVRRMV